MVWEQGSNTVVMITGEPPPCMLMSGLKEGGKIKCAQYWPAAIGTAAQYGDFNLHFSKALCMCAC